MYILVKVFLSTSIFSFDNIFNLYLHSHLLLVCVISVPKYLQLLTASKILLLHDRGNSNFSVFFFSSVTVRVLLLVPLD